MAAKKTIEQFIEESRTKHARDAYAYDRCLEYINNKTKLELYCNNHKEYFSISANDHLGKKLCGCPKCGYEKRVERQPKTFKEFLEKAIEIWGDTYTYFDTEDNYPSEGYVTIECKVHGMFTKLVGEHIRASRSAGGCQKCSSENKRTSPKVIKDYIEKASIEFKNKYDYSLIDHNNLKSIKQKVKIICPVHEEFEQQFDSHFIKYQHCNKCSKSYSSEEVSDIVKKNAYDFINTDNISLIYSNNFVKNILIKDLYCTKHKINFNQTYNSFRDGYIGCPNCSCKSQYELQIIDYIRSIKPDINIIHSYKPPWLQRKEIDIYLPEYNLGIEYNGTVFHHSSNSEYVNDFFKSRVKDKYYHFNKWKTCKDNGVILLSIYDFYWKDTIKQEILKSKIKHYLQLDFKIYARKCHIEAIDNNLAYSFYQDNHIEGKGFPYKNSKSFGLYFNNDLVMCVSIGEFYQQSAKKYKNKVHRICTLKDYTVVGGVSKLIKYLKILYPSFIYQITLFSGASTLNFYDKITFLDPRYFWVNSDTLEYHSRNYCQKNLLEKHFNVKLKPDDTENTYMERLNYLKVYDNGLAEIEV